MQLPCLTVSSTLESSSNKTLLVIMDIVIEIPHLENDVDSGNAREDSPLHLAAFHPSCNANVVRKMLDMGVPVNERNEFGQTPLHYMVRYGKSLDVIKLLLDNGAFVNALDTYQESPLHHALSAQNRNPEVIKLLLEREANVNVQNEYEEQPLHLAAKICDIDIINLLLEKEADVNALDINSESPLHHALNALNCDPRVIQLLLEKGVNISQENEVEWQPLHVAAYKCNADIVKLLLDHGALVNATDNLFQSPLEHALNAFECDPEVVNLLLERGADIHKTNFMGEQALHFAAYKCKPNIIQLLLDHGASVNVIDLTGKSPLHWALSTADSYPGVVKLLIKKGACLSQEDSMGQQPLHLASNHSDPDIVKLLLDCGASATALSMTDCSPLLNAVICNNFCDKLTVIRLLLEYGARVFLGISPLIKAVEVLNKNAVRRDPEKFELAFQCVQLLIKYGLLERPNLHFENICIDPQTIMSLLHFSNECSVEIYSECNDRKETLGQFIMQQREDKERNADEILQVLCVKPYPLYREVIAALLTKRQLKQKLEDQALKISMNAHTDKLNYYVVVRNIVKHITDHDHLLNIALTFHNLCQS